MIRVILGEDHALVREGLRRILGEAPDVRVVGEAADGDAVLARCREVAADVLVLDVSMPGPGFLKVLGEVVALGGPRVLVVSGHAEPSYARSAIAAGAAGYLAKEDSAVELATAVRRLAAGRRYVSRRLGRGLAEDGIESGGATSYADPELSPSEIEVLAGLGRGLSVKEVAERLGVSLPTVRSCCSGLLKKLRLRKTAELARYATEHRSRNGR